MAKKKKEKKQRKETTLIQIHDKAVIDGQITPEIPSNLPAVGGLIGVIDGLPNWADVKLLSELFTGQGLPWANEFLKLFLQKLELKKADSGAGVQIELDISAMERKNGKVDFAFKVANTYQTAYKRSDHRYHPIRSLYQDQVRFRIWPKDSSSNIAINQKASLPKADMKEVDYSNSTGWDTKVGFNVDVDKDGPSAGISAEQSRSFSISAGTKTSDFDMVKRTDDGKTLKWISRMRNMLKAGQTQPVPAGYNPQNVYSLVHKGAFETHLNDPPNAAGSDLQFEYLAAYTLPETEKKDKVVAFEFSTTQRLLHAEVVGRWGIPGAEVGGVAAVIPYHIFTKGEVVFDLSKRHVEAKKISCEGVNFKNAAKQKQVPTL